MRDGINNLHFVKDTGKGREFLEEVKETRIELDLVKEVGKICKALREDKEYYYAWQANIAMAFYDEYTRKHPDGTTIHTIANQAAKNFLDVLIKQGSGE